MNETPDIVMQCPKCKKEFPFDTNYCEDCTAMLEPTEREQAIPAQSSTVSITIPAYVSAASSDEMEDVRIDSLKTDIEESFISTLLFELSRLRERMGKKESALDALHKQQVDTSSPDHIQAVGRAEGEVNDILKRTAKIEAILDNLRKKLEADIDKLNTEIKKTEGTGFFAFLSASGRYYRILSAELTTKKALLLAIQTKTYNKKKGLLKYAFLAVLLLIIAGAMTYALTMVSRKSIVISSSTTSDKAAAKASIQAKDLYELLEDIRKANMKKDLLLWESRYAKQYLNDGKKKDETAEKWKKVDYISLQYSVKDVQMLPEGMTAIISWEMELKSIASGKLTKTSQMLFSEFIIEDHSLKIASVRKAEQ